MTILTKVVKTMRKEKRYADLVIADPVIHGLKPFDLAGVKIFWSLKTLAKREGVTMMFDIYRRLLEELKKNGIDIPMASGINASIPV
jgi:hypothetical protein